MKRKMNFIKWYKDHSINIYNGSIQFPYREPRSGVLYDLPEKWSSGSDPDTICTYQGKPIEDGQWIVHETNSSIAVLVNDDVKQFMDDMTKRSTNWEPSYYDVVNDLCQN